MKFVLKNKVHSVSIADIWTYDTEVFSNYFLLTAHTEDGRWFQSEDIDEIRTWVKDPNKILLGFNNDSFDDVLIKYIVENDDCDELDLYNLCVSIIAGLHPDVVKHYRYMKVHWKFSIDVFQLLNGKGSLKEWMAKYGEPKIVEAGVPFDQPLPQEMIPKIRAYCKNDVSGTHSLAKRFWHLVDLRTALIAELELTPVVYTLSEARIAQNVLMTLHERRTGEHQNATRKKARKNSDNNLRVIDPMEIIFDCVEYKTPSFKRVYEKMIATRFVGDPTGSRWGIRDKDFKSKIQIGSRLYKIGVGGIHSDDDPGRWETTDKKLVVDLDVTSYYPSIIINNNLHPAHMGDGFVEDIKFLRDKRVSAKRAQQAAKKDGDEKAEKKHKGVNEALKIVINSIFGKLNDMYCPFRSIPDALRVTVNGQLCILMLVEELESISEIVSANTDGVTIYIDKSKLKKLEEIKSWWSKKTGYELEQVVYKKFWRRDVNNYLAIDDTGKIKGKGEFATDDPKTKLEALAIVRAAIAKFKDGTPIMKSLKAEKEVNGFLFYQRVKNGGRIYMDDTMIGSIVRWYVAKKGGQIRRLNPPRKNAKDPTKKSWAKIPNGANAVLAQDISSMTIDKMLSSVDLEYYAKEAQSLLDATEAKHVSP